ncbi:MAG: hypothetical protein Q4C04_04325 [Clostridia bacterium]|nr:hypothetical protein [Clostridia bacterium]
MLRIDANNVDEFVGKTVDSKWGLFHHYPLTIIKHPTLGYGYIDRSGTLCLNDYKRDPVYYDEIVDPADSSELRTKEAEED